MPKFGCPALSDKPKGIRKAIIIISFFLVPVLSSFASNMNAEEFMLTAQKSSLTIEEQNDPKCLSILGGWGFPGEPMRKKSKSKSTEQTKRPNPCLDFGNESASVSERVNGKE